MKIIISGKYLTKPLNGIPRYANEIVNHLDEIITDKNVELYVPKNLPNEKYPLLHNIKIVQGGKSIKGWDYLYAERYAKKYHALYLNLCSQGVLYGNSIVCIHDLRPLTWDREHNVELKMAWTYDVKYKLIAKKAEKIVTDVFVLRDEIASCFDIDKSFITVIPCGWEHINRIHSDEKVFFKFSEIQKGSYYFSLGSVAPHKNFKWVLAMARKYPDQQFVISGRIDKTIWTDTIDFSKQDNVIFTGFVSDGEMKALMENAKALLFPSFYEGFGIPPLEAHAVGTPVFCSDIPVLREVYGDSVRYFDPYDTDVNLDKLWNEPIGTSETVLCKYTWKNAAKAWMRLIDEYLSDVE